MRYRFKKRFVSYKTFNMYNYTKVTFFDYLCYLVHEIYNLKDYFYWTYMFIRYPFLYPRNKISGLHYVNPDLEEYLKKYKKQHTNNHFLDDINDLQYFQKTYSNTEYNKKTNTVIYWDKKKYYIWYWFVKNIWYKSILQIIFCLSDTSIWEFWDCKCNKWKNTFGKQLLNDLKQQLKKDNLIYKFRITNITEKNGAFILYYENGNQNISNIIDKYSEISKNICKMCSKDDCRNKLFNY